MITLKPTISSSLFLFLYLCSFSVLRRYEKMVAIKSKSFQSFLTAKEMRLYFILRTGRYAIAGKITLLASSCSPCWSFIAFLLYFYWPSLCNACFPTPVHLTRPRPIQSPWCDYAAPKICAVIRHWSIYLLVSNVWTRYRFNIGYYIWEYKIMVDL